MFSHASVDTYDRGTFYLESEWARMSLALPSYTKHDRESLRREWLMECPSELLHLLFREDIIGEHHKCNKRSVKHFIMGYV
jgi:hypothetical protein